MPQPLLLTLDGAGNVRAADRTAPQLRADDLGVLRGDGVFETMHVRDGVVIEAGAHLDRMARSGELMDLAIPRRAALENLVAAAAEASREAWPAGCEGALRITVTRGVDHGDGPTVFATVDPIGAKSLKLRREGVRVLTATTGFATDVKSQAPWLLGGVKSLSYATNMAALRWAEANGADDVLWTSSDGYALEGPTSTLVWRDGDTLCSTPNETGILAGTSVRHLFAVAGELGFATRRSLITPKELVDGDGAWLVSSVRGVAGIRTLDGAALPYDETLTARLGTAIGFPSSA
ncbi:aminotransferase class IV [Fodinicola acaciae]|uniref:aminotransferase class IV n=1 Tax=Fodinicola acaciae TaxID=2681555 RepID=UPI0013D43194|nr:aminotransferase class IV [Fodinicola acaciae]